MTPAGALPAGGAAGSPASAMKRAIENEHDAPPPVKLAVMLPEPVADGPVKLFTTVTVVEALAVLFAALGSVAAEPTLAVLLTVPLAVALVATTSVKLAAPPLASVARLHVTVPPAPTAGVVQVKAGPEFCTPDTNVVPAGNASVSVTLCALLGPALLTPTL
jgi:hypothetical protein